MALVTLLHFFRSTSTDERRAQRLFRAHARQAVERVRATFDAWSTVRDFEPEHARLANAAAVNRWELMRLVHQTETLVVPRPLAGQHRELLEALANAARACQLLANGYRFHKSEAVCDGQALLLDTLAALDRLLGQLEPRDR